MKNIEEYTPCELATLATVVGIIIAGKFNLNQQNVVGDFLTGVAQSILIIAAQTENIQSLNENQNGDNGNSNFDISNNDLQNQIDELKEYIKKL